MDQNGLSAADVRALDETFVSPSTRLSFPPVVVRSGDGIELEDQDGRRYLDFHSMACITNTGQCHPKIVEAITAQASRLLHVNSGYFFHEQLARLARELVRVTPGDGDRKVAFGLSGSDANDGALKLVRAATRRPKVIAFTGAYHGNTYGALSLSAVSLEMRRGFGPVVPDVHHVPYPDTYRGAVGVMPEEAVEYCLGALDALFETVAPPDEVAAVFIEPIQGDAGILVPPKAYIDGLQKRCREHGILVVSEEVQTGMGRTGAWFASAGVGLDPDVVLVGKALASGLPLSAIVARAELMEVWRSPAHVFSTGANPLCCAAALATIQTIERDGLLENADRMGAALRGQLDALAAEFEAIGQIRGRGLLLGVDIVGDRQSRVRDRTLTAKILAGCLNRGLYLTFLRGNVLRLVPPLTVEERAIARAVEVLHDAIEDAVAGRVRDESVGSIVGW